MEVYILFYDEYIWGVYRSRERAEAMKKLLDDDRTMDQYNFRVVEWSVS